MKIYLLAMALFLGAEICLAGCQASDDSASLLADGSAEPVSSIANFHKVNDHLYRSGRPKLRELSQLRNFGIKRVISLEPNDSTSDVKNEEAAVRALGINFIRDPWSGERSSPPTTEQINHVIELMTDANWQPVLVHCHFGADRTGIAVAAYHIAIDHWPVEKAVKDMRNFHHSSEYYGWDSVLSNIR